MNPYRQPAVQAPGNSESTSIDIPCSQAFTYNTDRPLILLSRRRGHINDGQATLPFTFTGSNRIPGFKYHASSRNGDQTREIEQQYFSDQRGSVPKAWMIPKGIKFGRLDRLQFLEQSEEVDDEPSSSATFDHGSTSTSTVVTISTRAIGLNFADIFTVLGLYSAANLVRQPKSNKDGSLSAFVPGLEFAGTVVADPSGTFQKDERVLGFTRFGAYAERVSVPPAFLVPLPNDWTFAEGASFLVQALTAWHGLVEIGRMPNLLGIARRPHPFVVIVHSASGGVGLWASEIAARRGGTVLGIVGDESKKDAFLDRIVRELSPESRVMIRGEERDFASRLAQELDSIHGNGNESLERPSLIELAKGGYGADMVMESLGGKYLSASFDALNDGGALVTYGSTTYSTPGRGGINPFRLVYRYLTRPKIDPGDLTARNLRLCGFNLIFLTEQTEQLRRELGECIACLSGNCDGASVVSCDAREVTTRLRLSLDSVTPPVIGEEFDFRTQAIDAMEKLKGGKTVGKVVLINDDLDS
eukprot:jgi/Psemu1/326913/estExt_fgenesh1_pg.C_4940009